MKSRFGSGGGSKAKRSVVGALRTGLGKNSSGAGSSGGGGASKTKQATASRTDNDDDAYAAAYAAAYGNDDDGYSYGGTGSYYGDNLMDSGSLLSGNDDDNHDDDDDDYANVLDYGDGEEQQKQQQRPPPFQSRASSISLNKSDKHEARVDDIENTEQTRQAQVASLFPDISLGGSDTDEQMDGSSFLGDDDETYEEEEGDDDDDDDDDDETYDEEDEDDRQQLKPADDNHDGGALFPDILAEMDDDLGMLEGDDDESMLSASASEATEEEEAAPADTLSTLQADAKATTISTTEKEAGDADADDDANLMKVKKDTDDVDRTTITEVETPAASPENPFRATSSATDSYAYPPAEEVAVAVQQQLQVDQNQSQETEDYEEKKEEEEEEEEDTSTRVPVNEDAVDAAAVGADASRDIASANPNDISFETAASEADDEKEEEEEEEEEEEASAVEAAQQVFPEQVDDASEEELDDEIEKAIHDIESDADGDGDGDGDDASASASTTSAVAASIGGDDEKREEEKSDDDVVMEPTAVNTSDDSSSLRAAEASLVDDLSSHGDIEEDGKKVEHPEEKETEKDDENIVVEESRPTIDPTAIDSSDESSEDGEDTASSLNNSTSFAMVADDRSLGAENGPNSVDSNKASNADDNEDEGIEKSAYLPSTYSSTPPTPRKKDVAFAKGTTPKKKERSTVAVAIDDDDKTMASETSRRTTQTAQTSNTDATAQVSNLVLALVEPIDNRECGIGRGDIILSILSMPKAKSSRSAAAAPATGDAKVETGNTPPANDKAKSELAMWAGKNVKDAIWRMRKLHARIEKEVTANLPVPGSIEAISDDADLDKVSRPADASKYGRLLQNRAAEALRRNDLDKALEGYEEIYASYKIALERQRRKQGRHGNMSPEMDRDLKYHPSLGAALYNIGIVLLLSSRYEEALEKFEESRRVRAKKLGKQSAEYIASLSKKATALFALGRLPEAQAVFEEILAVAPKMTPADKAELAEIQNSYGCTLYAAGQRDIALRNFEQSLFINKTLLDESIYGDADASGELIMARTAATLNNIGQIGLKNREYEKAKAAFEGSYKYQFLLFNPSNPFVLATMDKLAFTNVKKGDRGKALSMYNQMLEAQIEVLGPHHIDCAQTLTKISLVHVEEKNFQAAETAAQMVVEAEARNENNPKVSGRFKSLSKAAKKGFKKKAKNMAADKN